MWSENEAQNQLWRQYEQRLLEAIVVTETALLEWNELADEAQQLYRDFAVKLTEVRKNVNISKIVGSSTSLGIGVPLMVAGAIALPFTFGVSTILIGVGAGVSATGGVVAGGASLTEFGIRKNGMKEIEEKQTNLKNLTETLSQHYTSLRAVLLEGAKHLDNPDSPFQDENKDIFLAVVDGGRIGVNAATVALRIALNSGDDVAKLVFAGSEVGVALGSTVGRVIFNSVFAAAAAGIDIYTIVTSSINMAKDGNKYDAIENLNSSANKLDELRLHVQTVIRRAKDTINGDAKGIVDEAVDTFRCCVCLEVTRPPLVACPSCKSFLGCEHCLLQWLTKHGTCPKCRAQWNPQHIALHRVHGADEFLKQLHKYEADYV